eukprot:s605_g4.t1
MGEPVEGVVLAVIEDGLTDQELQSLVGRVLLLEDGPRSLVEELLRIPAWQQEDLRRRLAGPPGLAPSAPQREDHADADAAAFARVKEIAANGGAESYTGPVPGSINETTVFYVMGLHADHGDWFYVLKCARSP